jgi:hypothetical protein
VSCVAPEAIKYTLTLVGTGAVIISEQTMPGDIFTYTYTPSALDGGSTLVFQIEARLYSGVLLLTSALVSYSISVTVDPCISSLVISGIPAIED